MTTKEDITPPDTNSHDPADHATSLTADWSAIQQAHPEANFLQSPAWAKMNQLIGHEVLLRNFGDNNIALMIIKNAKRGRYLEIPGGPLIDWSDIDKATQIFAEIRQIAKAHHCAFIRLRPQLFKTPENLDILKQLGAKPASFHLHAEHTVILDLTKSEDELLAAMRRQTRYEVRRSLKQELIVKSFTSEEKFREFHAVQTETARRQNFVPPSLDTLLAERTAFGDSAQLYIAYLSDGTSDTETGGNATALEPIAYGLILICGDEAEYFEAASTDLNRKHPGAYALQWQVIRDLKAQGIKRYNLWGIAPPDQPHHRYAKVTTFKTGFGGEVVEFVPAHDIVISKLKYLPNLTIETIRKKRRHLS